MALVRFNPWSGALALQNHINRFFDNDMYGYGNENKDDAIVYNWNPVVDIFEKDESIILKAEIPGIDKKDVSIEVKGNVLTLKGERSEEKEINKENYYRKERSFGKFYRQFTLSEEADLENIAADYDNGVLNIKVPKTPEKKTKQIEIN